jgi:uncharacterized membrane protein YjgN (DUF898 family)
MTDAIQPHVEPIPRIKVQYRPKPGLGALTAKNFFLNLLTLYIYSFWGKTNVRKHLWSCIHVMDEPLEYTGRGKELALGFLIVLGAFIVPVAVIRTTVQITFLEVWVSYALDGVIILVVLFLMGVATHRARRYRLSRTLWRGIRGTLDGSAWSYGVKQFGMTLLLPLTLLWSYPWMSIRLTSILTNGMKFGNRPFGFEGGSAPLYKPFAILWGGIAILGGLPIIGLVALALLDPANAADQKASADLELFGMEVSDTVAAVLAVLISTALPIIVVVFFVLRALYTSAELNYIARCTTFEDVAFKMNATVGSIVGLVFVNSVIMSMSLGIAAPFVQQRLLRYVCDRLTIEGTLDVAAIQQSQAQVDQTGEGLAEVFDIDVF